MSSSQNFPNISCLSSFHKNKFAKSTRFKLSVFSLWMWSNIKWFNRLFVVVARRYVFTRFNAENDKDSLIRNYIVCVTEQHCVSFFCTFCMVCRQSYAFQVIGRLVISQQNVTFIFSSFHFWLQLKSWNFWILCIKNQRFAYRPYTYEKNRNLVLFCNADKITLFSQLIKVV